MGEVQVTRSPVDGSIVAVRRLARPAEIDGVLERAVAAFRSWRRRPLEDRVACLRAGVERMVAQRDEVAAEITWQVGRPIRHAPGEVDGYAFRARTMLDLAPEGLAPLLPGDGPGLRRRVERVPLGVVLVLSPWNYPLLTAVNVVVPALAAGNVVVLKHSDQTPLCAERIVATLRAGGVPEDAIACLHLSHEQVAGVIRDPRVAHVAFTGSVEGGLAVQRAAAGRFIGVGLELGGKDPAYVREDADLDVAVPGVVEGALYNAGQSCCAVERVYVHRALYEAFLDRAREEVHRWRLGDPTRPDTTLGPVVRVRDAAAFPEARRGPPYLAPALLADVPDGARVLEEETFGPVLPVVPVADDQEAIARMNRSRYGLTASIWTRDVDAAERIGAELETGTVFMNRCDVLDPTLCWVGVKDSGRGCTLSAWGYHALTRPRSFNFRLS